MPGETVPGETVPGETVPGETVPGETAPGESAPGTAIKRAQAGRIASKPTNIWSGDRRLKFGL